MDLGECPKIHDLALRADYQLAAKNKDYYYDVDVSSRSVLYYLQVYLGIDVNYELGPSLF